MRGCADTMESEWARRRAGRARGHVGAQRGQRHGGSAARLGDVADEVENWQALRRREREVDQAIGGMHDERVDVGKARVDALLMPELRHREQRVLEVWHEANVLEGELPADAVAVLLSPPILR